MSSPDILDLSPLENALKQLKKSVHYYQSELASKDEDLRFQFIAASIQGFEFTYELTKTFLMRILEIHFESTDIIKSLSFNDLIRLSCDKGLLQHDLSIWKQYRQMRNITSHTYNETKALAVMSVIPSFIAEAEFALSEIKKWNQKG